jgi:uncharacterized protein with GYD domain
MSQYLIRYRYPKELWQGLVAKPEDRRAQIREMTSAFGIDLKEMWYTPGPYDVIWLIEAPDNIAPAAYRIFDLAHGYVPDYFEVTPLHTVEETIEALKLVHDRVEPSPLPRVEELTHGFRFRDDAACERTE